uniref:SRR1-like protein isoform X1 n=1 Tax=Podarcis muralis TaxID=64176 RepID=UPI00109EE736|nr:SRR1-like protein isoform X1 [Podarcis muralis]
MAAAEWVRVTEVVCLPRAFPLWSLRVPRRDSPGGIALAPGFAWSAAERAKAGTPREGAGGGGASGGERSGAAERPRAPRTREKGRGGGCGRRVQNCRAQNSGIQASIPEDLCYIFDPVFSTLEIKVLAHLGLTVLLENEEGKCCIHNPTIFYMVHCGKALYNNLLWSNWSIEALSKTVIIGNSFKGIEDRVLSRIFQKDYSYIAKVLIATDEEALPSHPQYLDIFNDTSVHCFPLEKLRDLPPEIWKLQEEPVYPDEDQPEIIRNKK